MSPNPRPTLKGHIQIARFDHWFKNVFVFPGIVVALSVDPAHIDISLLYRTIIGLLATGFIASANYTINEILDAPYDRLHPLKNTRPVPSGRVNIPLGYLQWILLLAAGVGLAFTISPGFVFTMALFWVQGCLYNIRPFRTKERPYLDVLSESVNNPIRMLAGWYIADVGVVPITSLLVSYWMIGAYFMAIKRYAEYREIADPELARKYRRSFGYYNEQNLLVSIMFYASLAMLFMGAFIIRYRLELIVSFPFISLVMALYLNLGFKEHSAAQRPEKLYREPALMAAVSAATSVFFLALFVDIPLLYKTFAPSQFGLHR